MTARTESVQTAMAEAGFDALVIVSPPNMAYVSGFLAMPGERLMAVIVPHEGPLRVVVPALEDADARASLPTSSVLHVWRDEDGPAAALAAGLAGLGRAVGIEKGHLTVASAELIQEALPACGLLDCGPLLADLRVVKDAHEVELVSRAVGVLDRAIERLATEELRAGISEAALAVAAQRLLTEEGSEANAFVLALAGADAALPHGRPGHYVLAEGDLVLVDLGASIGGYWADITRTFVLGEADQRQRELAGLVRAAGAAGIAAIRPGVTAAEVDRAARSVLEEAGLGDYFLHRTGHGIGLEPHEPPFLTSSNLAPLREGTIVTVEPGVYIPGYGGVRFEEAILVRREPVCLTHATRKLEVAA